MKVRIGIGTGAGAGQLDAESLVGLAMAVHETRFDSLWLPEILMAPGGDPLVALAWVGAAVPAAKLGTTLLLPGRHPVRLAKELATLDRLSGGRLLVTFVPGLTRGAERRAVGVEPAERGPAMEETLPLLRRLFAGEVVTLPGPTGPIENVALSPGPLQNPFDMWLGGTARSAQERCGRIADGWLPTLLTPAEAAAGKAVVERAAADAGRTISPEHFGVSLAYATTPPQGRAALALAKMIGDRDPRDRVPLDLTQLRTLLGRFVDQGFSKFVLRPLVAPSDWRAELETLAGSVGDLQT